ncbi:MAG: ABC-ATPase domain-containing protein [Oleiphilaceae bacterium]|nr:ABC-ATPase domain-containing protein [Oleiphilaceae bacterium]
MTAPADTLARQLEQLEGRGYKAYKGIAGTYPFPGFTLLIDHVQADPFAAPSRFRAIVPAATAQLPNGVFRSHARQRSARDFIARAFRQAAGGEPAVRIDAGAQTVLERTAVLLDQGDVELRFTVALPGRGRSILGHRARKLICQQLPEMVMAAATGKALDTEALERHMAVVEDQVALREALSQQGLVAFVANDAMLARRSGVDDRPLTQGIPFHSPASLQVSLEAPNGGRYEGMGIPKGITLMVGGGFHGKSTLLSAVAVGVYDHIPGDGREGIVTDPDAMKIRAEDSRAVHRVDLSPYINHLPYGKATDAFSTELASGSTSQAAALQEALEAGSRTLLVDEDTSASNFMIRDQRMQALVNKSQEPITPLVDRIRQLRDELSVSVLLVMGGSGDYFDCADTVIQLQAYQPLDVTAEAHRIAAEHTTGRVEEALDPLSLPVTRALKGRKLNPEVKPGKRKIQARGEDTLIFGRQDVDLRAVEQIADPSQIRTIGQLMVLMARETGQIPSPPDCLRQRLNSDLWRTLTDRPMGDLAMPRVTEVMATLNRLRANPFAGGD